MACRGCWECLLKLLNFVLAVSGLAMVGYGIYLLVMWNKASGSPADSPPFPPPAYVSNDQLLTLGRPMLFLVSVSDSIIDKLPKAWFIYLFIGVGAVIFLISCCGCIGAVARNTCCLSFYAFLLILLILVELGCAAFIFFYNDWKDVIPVDKTGNFDMIYDFLDDNWKIIRWVAIGIVGFQALVFLLALIVRAANSPAEYDSDDEYIAPRSTVRQPLVNRQNVPATGVPVVGTLDHRPSRNDAWSTRMREKYGLDTSEFTYNPSDPNRLQQATAPPTEDRSRCAIM